MRTTPENKLAIPPGTKLRVEQRGWSENPTDIPKTKSAFFECDCSQIQLFYVDPDSHSDDLFSRPERIGIAAVQQFSTFAQLEAAARSAEGPVIVSVTGSSEDQPAFLALAREIERLNASQGRVRVRTMVLLIDALPPKAVDALERTGVRVFLRSCPRLIEQFARLLAWQLGTPAALQPSFYLAYQDAVTLTVYLQGRIQAVEMAYGDRLATLFETLALNPRWFSTRQLADELEISGNSVKVYLARLRQEYDSKRWAVGVDIPSAEVFRSVRVNGAWLHRLSARIRVG
jgi:hypothetical protein